MIRVRLKDGVPTGEYEDFMTGFVVNDSSVWGRPVGVTVAHDGALLTAPCSSARTETAPSGGFHIAVSRTLLFQEPCRRLSSRSWTSVRQAEPGSGFGGTAGKRRLLISRKAARRIAGWASRTSADPCIGAVCYGTNPSEPD